MAVQPRSGTVLYLVYLRWLGAQFHILIRSSPCWRLPETAPKIILKSDGGSKHFPMDCGSGNPFKANNGQYCRCQHLNPQKQEDYGRKGSLRYT